MNILLRRLAWIIMIVPAIYLAIIWKQIPPTVPLHFDLHGNPDKYGTKNNFVWLIAGLTLLNAIAYIVVTNIYKIDPKKYAVLNKDRLQRIAFYVTLYLSAIWVMLIYQVAHNETGNIMKFVFIAMGLLFALLGNNMYNIKPNYFAGLRLPWTLENEYNWKKTHQFAGRLWFFGGLFFAAMVLLLNDEWAVYTGAASLAILILIPVFYSYNLYKNQTKKNRA